MSHVSTTYRLSKMNNRVWTGTTLWALGVGGTHLKAFSSQIGPEHSIFIQRMSSPALGDPPIFPYGQEWEKGRKRQCWKQSRTRASVLVAALSSLGTGLLLAPGYREPDDDDYGKKQNLGSANDFLGDLRPISEVG